MKEKGKYAMFFMIGLCALMAHVVIEYLVVNTLLASLGFA